MKKPILLFVTVMLFSLSSKATSKAVFIYNTDLVTANSFKALLDTSGFTVTTVPIASTIGTNYSDCDIIITSPTASLTKAQVDTINSKNKPILSMSGGGYNSFGLLSLAIGKPNGMSGNENTMIVEDANLSVYTSPYNLNVSTGDSLRLFSVAASASPARMIYVPTPIASIEGLLKYKPLYYSVIRQNGKYTFWGFSLSPASMTQQGKDLFVNVVGDAIVAYNLVTGVSSTTRVGEPSLSVNRLTGILSIGGVNANASISVVDLSGKTVVKNQQQTHINLSGLNKGVYVVKVKTSNGIVAKKFVY
ncbi:MAG: T9SS type A sorting domain-containing protein [Bacteroidales bacterium]|nr:T9SS type A sorting domain-containing protein [Bacteroidales bacterium]